jgi:mercuric ion binding protein
MKKIFLVLSMIFLSMAVSGQLLAQEKHDVAAPQTITVKVKGMVCSFCAQGLRETFEAQPAVSKTEVKLKTRTVTLSLKPNAELSDAEIKAIVKDAGYLVEGIRR